MRFHQVITYLLIVMAIYFGLFLIDYLVLTHLLDFFTFSKVADYIFIIVSLLIINPVITYHLAAKVPFKMYGLLVDEGLDESLKQHQE